MDSSQAIQAPLINYVKAYNDRMFAANLITISGLAIGGITGGNNSAATDYILDANTKTVAASITRADLQIRANNDASLYYRTMWLAMRAYPTAVLLVVDSYQIQRVHRLRVIMLTNLAQSIRLHLRQAA